MQKNLYSFFNTDLTLPAMLSGFVFGIFIPMIFEIPLGKFDMEIRSVFMSDSGFSAFLSTLCTQAFYPIMIFILGFIPCTALLRALLIFSRASAASFSLSALAFSSVSNYIYALHTLTSVTILALCWALSKCALNYQKNINKTKGFLLYTLEFLFFSGILLTALFLREVALAFA